MRYSKDGDNKKGENEITNIFHLCRIRANEKYGNMSRINVADSLGISESSLKNYETGVTLVVPSDVVLRMSKLYNAPELRNHYCRNMCPLGTIQAPDLDVEQLHLDRLTIKLLNSIKEIGGVRDSLIEIAADGIIDSNEKPELEKILKCLDDITKHAQELKLWAEKELHL